MLKIDKKECFLLFSVAEWIGEKHENKRKISENFCFFMNPRFSMKIKFYASSNCSRFAQLTLHPLLIFVLFFITFYNIHHMYFHWDSFDFTFFVLLVNFWKKLWFPDFHTLFSFQMWYHTHTRVLVMNFWIQFQLPQFTGEEDNRDIFEKLSWL
jgi:hypothetical protein